MSHLITQFLGEAQQVNENKEAQISGEKKQNAKKVSRKQFKKKKKRDISKPKTKDWTEAHILNEHQAEG